MLCCENDNILTRQTPARFPLPIPLLPCSGRDLCRLLMVFILLAAKFFVACASHAHPRCTKWPTAATDLFAIFAHLAKTEWSSGGGEGVWGGHNNIRAFCLSHFVPSHAPAHPQRRPLSCLPLLVSLLTFGSVSFLFSSYLPPPLTLPRPACCLLLSPTLAASVGGGLCGRGGGRNGA